MTSLPSQLHAAQVYRTACAPAWTWDNPGKSQTRTLDLWLVTAGRGVMTIRGRTYELSPGDCFVIRMNEPCSARHDARHPLTVHWAFIEYPLDWPEGDAQLPALHRRVRDLPLMMALFERALTAQQEGDPNRAQAWLLTLLRALSEDDTQVVPPPGTVAAQQREQILKIGLRIRNNPGQHVSIPQLADECHCTPGHFTRRFEACMGVTPREFMVNARIEAAKSLLRMSDHKIADIAQTLSFCDLFHFSKQFKQKTGLSPSSYRQRI